MTKKSRSTVNSPIFTCRSRISLSWSPTCPLRPLREDVLHPLHRPLLPDTHVVRMDLVPRGDLLDRLVPAKRLQCHLRLELPRESPSRRHRVSLPLQVEYTLAICPIFRDHLTSRGPAVASPTGFGRQSRPMRDIRASKKKRQIAEPHRPIMAVAHG